MAALRVSDYRAVLHFLHTAGGLDDPVALPEPALAELRRLIPCDVVSYGDFDPSRRGWRSAPRWVGEPQAPVTSAIREAFHALRHQYTHSPAAADAQPVLRWSDRAPRKVLQRLELYRAVWRPLGCEHQLTAWLADTGGIVGSLVFARSRGDFAERDVAVLETLRPHLVQLARNARRRRGDGAGLLTPREREVLRWVARGKTNREIAAVLYLSPQTVRKHLENTYAKLGVRTRTGAVARAFGLDPPG